MKKLDFTEKNLLDSRSEPLRKNGPKNVQSLPLKKPRKKFWQRKKRRRQSVRGVIDINPRTLPILIKMSHEGKLTESQVNAIKAYMASHG